MIEIHPVAGVVGGLIAVALVVYEYKARKLKFGLAFVVTNIAGIVASVSTCYALLNIDSGVALFFVAATACFVCVLNNSLFVVKLPEDGEL